MPAAFATRAAPCARTRWRRASRRTRGSSSSSSAACRYSAAKPGSLRNRRTIASSWEMLALRFTVFSPFLVVLQVIERPGDVGGLFSFVTAAKQQHANPAEHRVIDPVPGPPLNPQFVHALAQGPAVAKVSRCQPVDSTCDLRLSMNISQSRQPIVEYILSSAADIMADLDHRQSVTYTLHQGKQKKPGGGFESGLRARCR